jgi:predicted DCC family thiol-disulfide oxidoreductase YuxK
MTVPTNEGNVSTSSVPVDTVPPVLFFDGECGLCSHSVRWLLVRDRRRLLRFAPLQGRLAAQKFVALPTDYHDWAVALWDEQGIHYESDATLRALACLGGMWRFARLLLIIPRSLRNGVYRFVARNRIRWFGRVDSCALLAAEDRDRLLP